MEFLRQRIEASVLAISRPPGSADFLRPAGDPGLFGPDSAAWQVHGDFTAMLIGGVGALMLQMLHPLALAGVWDHSNFQADMLGRLRRTAQFIAGTTFGGRDDAQRLIARVRQIHLGVSGHASDGRHYAASDPELLSWVHCAEVSCFLRAYVRYRNPGFPASEQDRYYDEIATVALALGARDVPRSGAAMDAYLQSMRPQLRCDERTRKTLELVMQAPAPNALALPWTRLMMHAGVDLLPPAAKQMLDIAPLSPRRAWLLQRSVWLAARPIRWAVRNGSVHLARRRLGLPARDGD
ncbi:oxygenase MpaB family protein [Herbaspirillum sp. alder98]|uniref:oxygenase MpaB family protein n=1 Tax=Herbaspirillum sp. alder98 TaxID=2913096 RepID=UPI001CD8A9DE|nr:oxygenase MpaB family protein [Herbaspirillum sp. alder98]MCA1326527.1 oxygenase MpaB family protein [Herbaspirillum sp. alder98]